MEPYRSAAMSVVSCGAEKLPAAPDAPLEVTPMTLSTRRFLLLMVWTLVAIFLLHVAFQLTLTGDGDMQRGLRRIVDPALENSIPTYLATMLLTACALLALWLARVQRLPWPGWTGLALIFGLAAVEEIVGVHESLSRAIRAEFDTSGLLYYPWVAPAAILVLLIGLAYLRPVFSVPPPVRNRLVLGAVLFLTGALAFESLSANAADAVDNQSGPYVVFSTVEEALEFAGVLVWLQAMLLQLRLRVGPSPKLQLVVSEGREREGAHGPQRQGSRGG